MITLFGVWLLKLEDGQVRLQSRLEQEEEAKAALMSRIQRLTKLILVSTKASQSPKFSNRPGQRRRHSFGEEEVLHTFFWFTKGPRDLPAPFFLILFLFFPLFGVLGGWLALESVFLWWGDSVMLLCFFHLMWQLAYLPHRRRDLVLDDENMDMYVSLDGNADNVDEKLRDEKRIKKNGLLSWLKPRVRKIIYC